jgi:hypothetical protein
MRFLRVLDSATYLANERLLFVGAINGRESCTGGRGVQGELDDVAPLALASARRPRATLDRF